MSGASRPPEAPPSPRGLLVLALALTLLGSCGASSGVSQLVEGGGPGGVASGGLEAETQQRLAEALADPRARPLAMANLVVSALLLLAGAALLLRRRTAVWWVTQASLANGLWVVLGAASALEHLYATKAELLPLFVFVVQETASSPEAPPGPLPEADVLFSFTVATLLVGALARIAVYIGLAVIVRRPSIVRQLR